MKETFKELAVNSRKIAHDYVEKMESELKSVSGNICKAEEYMELAKYHYSEAKKHDDQGMGLS